MAQLLRVATGRQHHRHLHVPKVEELPGVVQVRGEEKVLEAMRYSTLSGGKRLRPSWPSARQGSLASARNRPLKPPLPSNSSTCYSLVHDDLPAMDNDDLRRGRPAAHKKFGDAAAILLAMAC